MKAMVTGSTGFLGKNTILELVNDVSYEKIYAVNRKNGYSIETIASRTERLVDIYSNLENPGYCQSLFNNIKPDIIFHFAAEQGRTPEAFQNNVLMTANILRYCPEGVKFVYASSSTVYGNLALGCKEDSNHINIEFKCVESHPTIPTSLYGASKLAGEAIVHAYHSAGKIDPLILRYVAMVGKGATHGVLPDIIRKLKLPGDNVELFGDEPGSIKPYIHISDAIDATLYLVKNKNNGIFNVAPDDEISIKDIADIADTFINRMNPIAKIHKWLGSGVVPTGDNSYVALDNTKLLAAGWKPKYKTCAEAITTTLEEMEECEF